MILMCCFLLWLLNLSVVMCLKMIKIRDNPSNIETMIHIWNKNNTTQLIFKSETIEEKTTWPRNIIISTLFLSGDLFVQV